MLILLGDDPSNSDTMFQSGDAEVDAEEAIFVELIQTLLKEPAEREHFYQVSQPCVYIRYHSGEILYVVFEEVSILSFPGGFSIRIWSQLRRRHAAPCVGVSFQTGETPASTRPWSGRS